MIGGSSRRRGKGWSENGSRAGATGLSALDDSPADPRQGQGEVALPPEHDLGAFHQGPSGRAQAGYPILADADDGQPPC